MKNNKFELINSDTAIRKLNDCDVPSIVLRGGKLIFSNCKEELFVMNGRSAFSVYRDSYKRIRVPVGMSYVVVVPTAQGKRAAVLYGRENDTIFLFPRYAYDLFDVIEYQKDTVLQMLGFIIERFLYSDLDFSQMCRFILERSNYFDSQVRITKLLMLAEQICRRITRREIFESSVTSDVMYVTSEDAIKVITELSQTIAQTKPNSVSFETSKHQLSIYADGICLFSSKLFVPEFMVTQPFITTVNDMMISSLTAFASELYYYET